MRWEGLACAFSVGSVTERRKEKERCAEATRLQGMPGRQMPRSLCFFYGANAYPPYLRAYCSSTE